MASLLIVVSMLSMSLKSIDCEFWRLASGSPPAAFVTPTTIPRVLSPGLSLSKRTSHASKCVKEVPAIFFQYEKDVQIVGNSSSDRYFNVVEVCCDGYKRYDYDWNKCVPDCKHRCQYNGFCLEGSYCRCFDDFVLNHRDECVPTCPLGCPHGRCFLNGTCVCERGWELDPSKSFCAPQCKRGCARKEMCTAPDVCECMEGYARSTIDTMLGCQPVCIPDCGYGYCVAPNECKCFHGYHKRTNKTTCESNCYMRCENGFCANRSTCVCQDGFKYDADTASCLPDCADNCDNGVCVSPGVCRCFNGYARHGVQCKAVCERSCGFYGVCIAPDVCGCAVVEGPTRSYQMCRNGSCNSKGRCVCEPGMTRFISQCLSPDEVTTAAAIRREKLNASLVQEFNLLIGQHFHFRSESFK